MSRTATSCASSRRAISSSLPTFRSPPTSSPRAATRSIRAASSIHRRTSRSAWRCATTWTSCAGRVSGPADPRRSTTRTASASRTSSTAFSRVTRMRAMARSILPEEKIHPAVREKVASYRTDILKEVRDAVAANQIVVVGMRQNPFPKKARKLLDDAGLAYKYLEYGSYLGEWRRRLALKMWTGWPTFPMVFVKGVLIGGGSELPERLPSGEVSRQGKGFLREGGFGRAA